jgi:diguanylate cyclase (GGDEF)-like protein
MGTRKNAPVMMVITVPLFEGAVIYLANRFFSLPLWVILLGSASLAAAAAAVLVIVCGRKGRDEGFGGYLFGEGAQKTDATADEGGTFGDVKIDDQLKVLNKRMRKQIYDLHNLFEVSINLTSILEPQQLIKSSVLSIIGQLQTNEAIVFLPNKNNNDLIYPVYYKGFSQQQWRNYYISTRDPIFNQFHKKMIALDLTKVDKKYINEKWQTLMDSGITLIAPIIFKFQIKGLIALGQKMNQEIFSQSEQEIFSLLSHFISVAFSNSVLYQKMEQISITDELTGLHNYRYFKKRLAAEVMRAQRYKHPLSLILLDVDYFKNYNDALGHPAGDKALKKIAQLIMASVRKSDIAVRYGGEEFCIILPEVEKTGAHTFAERLRILVENHPFDGREIQPDRKVSVSLGVASFPSDTTTMQDLIDKADAALYHAKHMGRNRTCLYTESIV